MIRRIVSALKDIQEDASFIDTKTTIFGDQFDLELEGFSLTQLVSYDFDAGRHSRIEHRFQLPVKP